MAAAFERQPWSWRPMPPRTQLVQVDKFRFPALHALLDLNKADMGYSQLLHYAVYKIYTTLPLALSLEVRILCHALRSSTPPRGCSRHVRAEVQLDQKSGVHGTIVD